MKKKMSLVLGTILTLSLCLLTACGGGGDEGDANLVGAYDNDEEELSIVFDGEGGCQYSDLDVVLECTYTVKSGELEIDYEGQTVGGTYDAGSDTFTLDGYAGEFYFVEDAYYTP